MQIALMLPTKYLLQSSNPTQVWLPNTNKGWRKVTINCVNKQTSWALLTNQEQPIIAVSYTHSSQSNLLFIVILSLFLSFKYASLQWHNFNSFNNLFLASIYCFFIKINTNICPQQTMHFTAKPSSTK